MNTQPLVSIVLPTYNGSRYLSHSIRSCLEQTYRDVKLIVVDDASTDDTPDIVARFQRDDARVVFIRHATNRKLPAALNTGFSQAKGAYLTWTSDDNTYHPTALAEMVDYLEANPGVGMVHADYSMVDEADRIIDYRRVGSVRELLISNCIGACFLYRREVAEAVGRYSDDMYLAEDYDYWLRIAARFRVGEIHKSLYSYRVHGNSLTHSAKRDRLHRASAKALSRNISRLQWADARAKAEAYIRLAIRAKSRRDFYATACCLATSVRYSPRTTASILWTILLRQPILWTYSA